MGGGELPSFMEERCRDRPSLPVLQGTDHIPRQTKEVDRGLGASQWEALGGGYATGGGAVNPRWRLGEGLHLS